MATRILIADDDVPIRTLLRRLLEEHSDWVVCGEAGNGQEAVTKVEELNPDIVILDLAMPMMNGFQAARQISTHHPTIPMLLLTVQEVSNELAKESIKAGFTGAVTKDTGVEVVEAVNALLQCGSVTKTTPTNPSALSAS